MKAALAPFTVLATLLLGCYGATSETVRRRVTGVPTLTKLTRLRADTGWFIPASGTQGSGCGIRIADGGPGSDDAGRTRHGRPTGRVRRVRARDLARAGSRWLGPCTTEREAPRTAANGGAEGGPGTGALSPRYQ